MNSRIFNSQEGTRSRTANTFNLFTQSLDTGLFSYYTNTQELEVSIEEGTLFTEVTQFYCKDIAVKTRIYHPHYEHSSMKHTLQQLCPKNFHVTEGNLQQPYKSEQPPPHRNSSPQYL